MTRPPDLKEIDEEVEKLNKEKEEAVANQDFEKAANLRDQAEKLRKKKIKSRKIGGIKVRRLTVSWMRKSSQKWSVK